MAELIAVVGDTGEGKTHSIRTLDPKETAIINVAGKTLNFRGWKKDYKIIDTSKMRFGTAGGQLKVKIPKGNFMPYDRDPSKAYAAIRSFIAKASASEKIKHVVVDDFQYLMSFEYFKRAKEPGWDKFTDVGQKLWKVLRSATGARDGLNIFVLTHDETVEEDYTAKRKIKTIGKMVDEKMRVEGLFNIVLFTDVDIDSSPDDMRYGFTTQTDGVTTAKSPHGMFPEPRIPNDLQYVADCIKAFYEGEELPAVDQEVQ